MALSELQRSQVRAYLGAERGYDLNPALESKLDSLSATEETLILAVISSLEALEVKTDGVALNGVLETIQLGAGENGVTLRDGDPLELYAKQGRRLVARLESLTGVAAARDYFGLGTQGGSMGGAIVLG